MSFLSTTSGYSAIPTMAAPVASMPVTTSVPVTTAVVPIVPIVIPYGMRVTLVDLKHGGEQKLKDVLQSDEFNDELDGLKGRQQFTGFFMEDATGKTHMSDKMVVTSLYDSQENMENALEVNKRVLGQYSYWMDGAPTIHMGPVGWYVKGRAAKQGKVAQRITVANLTPGGKNPVLETLYYDARVQATMEGEAFDKLIEVICFFPSDDQAVVVSLYASMDSMPQATAGFMDLMKPIAPYLKGAPQTYAGMLEWTLPEIPGRKKPTTSGCLQC